MTERPRVLLIDDGELHTVAHTLDEMGVPYTRIAGCEASGDLIPPLELLISTPSHAGLVRRGSPAGAARGRPVRVIATDENSPGVRRRLERMGFQILVRPSAHADVWKLLIERAIDADQRGETRVEVGSPVQISTGRAQQVATLVDISNRGCRLRSAHEFRAGARMSFVVEGEDGDGPTQLCGRVVRVTGELDPAGDATHAAALLFDDDMPAQTRARLTRLLNAWSRGEGSWSHADEPALPSRSSRDDPDFSLDDETDPLLAANVDVRLQMQPDAMQVAPSTDERETRAERRRQRRSAFATPIVATSRGRDRLLVGRDISPEGMRIEAGAGLTEGERLRLALYGPSDMQPLPVAARVVRSDGERGFALHFEDVTPDLADRLDKLVACLPQLESLTSDDGDPISAVVSQILAED